MNQINIRSPRWHSRDVLIASWKVGDMNEIRIESVNRQGVPYFPNPIVRSGAWIRQYPQIKHLHGLMIEIPLDDLIGETNGRQPQTRQADGAQTQPGTLQGNGEEEASTPF